MLCWLDVWNVLCHGSFWKICPWMKIMPLTKMITPQTKERCPAPRLPSSQEEQQEGKLGKYFSGFKFELFHHIMIINTPLTLTCCHSLNYWIYCMFPPLPFPMPLFSLVLVVITKQRYTLVNNFSGIVNTLSVTHESFLSPRLTIKAKIHGKTLSWGWSVCRDSLLIQPTPYLRVWRFLL